MEFLLLVQVGLLLYIAAKLRGDIWKHAHRQVAWFRPKLLKKLKFFQADFFVYPKNGMDVTDSISVNGATRKIKFPVLARIYGMTGRGIYMELELTIAIVESFKKAIQPPLLEIGFIKQGINHGWATCTLNLLLGERVENELGKQLPMIFTVSGKALKNEPDEFKTLAIQDLEVIYEGSIAGPADFFDTYERHREAVLSDGGEFAAIVDSKFINFSNHLHEKFKDADGWSPYRIPVERCHED